MAASKKNLKVPSPKGRNIAPSAPEVKLGYANVGRDTLAAIEQELGAPSLSPADAPVIEISETPVGRDTMAAIAEELAGTMRPRQNTLPYDDKIRNAPGGSPSRAPGRSAPAPAPAAPVTTLDSGPEVSFKEDPAPITPRIAPESLEIFELLTFIVRGNQVGDLSTDALRRRFVETHLLHRVPSGSMDTVERIEVTPWTAKGTMVVRVWCRA